MAFGLTDTTRQRVQQGFAQSPMGVANQAIRGAQEQGFLNPAGSPALRERIRRHALRTARNRIGRGGTLSRIAGLDPQQARIAQLQTEQGAGEDISNTLGSAFTQEELGNRDYFRSLFGDQLNFERQRMLQKEAAKQARQAAGNPLARLAGAGLGFLPGGSFLSGLFGGGVSNNPADPRFMGPTY